MDGKKEYKRMITKIKEIACEFSDDVEKACVPAVLRSIAKRNGQHLKESISVRHHVQTRYDPYLQVDEGWNDSTEELVTEIFMLAVRDHMPRPVKLDGTDEDTKLLGALVHWIMRNNLITIVNKYPAIQASRDFDVFYGKLRRVITDNRQHGGSYYERLCREQEDEKSGRKHKAVNPVVVALAKKKKVTLSVDTAQCKYCGKLYHTGKKLMEHINQEHAGEQTIYGCPFWTQPYNQYSEYLQHLGEHKDRVIRCRLCNK